MPDRPKLDNLLTEQRNPASRDIDSPPALEMHQKVAEGPKHAERPRVGAAENY